MPKKLSTFARVDGGVRNPFTRRVVELNTPIAKQIILLAHRVNEFKARLKAAGIPRPDRQMVVDQWRYIARLTDERPRGLPTPAPGSRPPKLALKAASGKKYGCGCSAKKFGGSDPEPEPKKTDCKKEYKACKRKQLASDIDSQTEALKKKKRKVEKDEESSSSSSDEEETLPKWLKDSASDSPALLEPSPELWGPALEVVKAARGRSLTKDVSKKSKDREKKKSKKAKKEEPKESEAKGAEGVKKEEKPKKEKKEDSFKESGSSAVYMRPSAVDTDLIAEPLTFLIGPGASGIDVFGKMSDSAAKRLNKVLEAAWSKVEKHSESEDKDYMSRVDFSGSAKDYFFPDDSENANAGEQLRRCMTTVAAEYYTPLMLAAWEFLYDSVKNKKPAATHDIIRALEPLKGADGRPVLSNVVTANVDGLEFAAGISPDNIVLAHGSVLLRQKANTAIGSAKASPVESVDEIRSGKYRPAIVLYGESLLPSSADLRQVAQNATRGTLVAVGCAGWSTAEMAVLQDMRLTTAIVVKSKAGDAEDAIAALNNSSDRTGRAVTPRSDETIDNFYSENTFALRNPNQLQELLDRVYKDLEVKKHTKTPSELAVIGRIARRFNEFAS